MHHADKMEMESTEERQRENVTHIAILHIYSQTI